MSHSPRMVKLSATLALCIAVIAGGSALIALRSAWSMMGGGTYVLNEQRPVSFTYPLFFLSEPGQLRIEQTVTVGALRPAWFSITPDDCLERLMINGKNVPIPEPLCLDMHGTDVRIGHLLHPGKNSLSFIVRDHGGYAALSMAPSLKDPLISSLLGLLAAGAIIAVTALLVLLRPGATVALLVFILGCGLLLRLALSPTQGYGFDVSTNQGWAKSAALLGIATSYEQQLDGTMLPNYPPLSMLLFGATGHAYQWLWSPGFDRLDPLMRVVIKMPGMLADILTAALLFAILRKARDTKTAMIGTLIYALHPAVIYNSAVWGQIDSVYTLFIVAALAAGMRSKWLLGGLSAALAVLTKMQAVIVLPAMTLWCLRGRRPALLMLLGGATAVVVVLVPFLFGGVIDTALGVYVDSVGKYPSLSFGAYNMWQTLFGDQVGKTDTEVIFGMLSYRRLGLLLFALTPLSLAVLRWKRFHKEPSSFPENLTPMLMSALIAYAFFLFNTEMHERYLFPLMALGLPFVFVSRAAAVTYAVSSLLFYLNLTGQLPFNAFDTTVFALFPEARSTIGAWHTAAFAVLFAITLKATAAAKPHARPGHR